MQGKDILMSIGGFAALLAGQAANACSLRQAPFSAEVQRLEPDRWALRARSRVDFEIFEDDHWRGTLQLWAIECLRRPRGQSCPASLSIPFEYRFDGESCPSPLEGNRPDEASPFRYFILHRGQDGRWSIDWARREYWRLR